MNAVRIANISGFYGDRAAAAREQVQGGPVDFLTGDWLAELTMAVLLKDRMKDPDGGFARTFLPMLKGVLAECAARRIRVVANAGGLNPEGLARKTRALVAELGLDLSVAWVGGDDVTARLDAWKADGRLGTPPGSPLAAHAYLGAWPIARALDAGADIVITGRCADAALVVGPAAHAHGWATSDWDRLAGALVAGHIIECGAQATGGNLPFFDEVPGLDRVGFPIAEVLADGASVITKHPGTGGKVDVDTVTAQLLYEVGPRGYLSPDVVADLASVRLSVEGPDRVRISGVRGAPPPPTLKVGVLCHAGHRNQVKVLLSAPRAREKADRVARAFWATAGGPFLEQRSDLIGGDDTSATPDGALAVLLLTARAASADAVGRKFTAAAVELALASVPGLTLLDPPEEPRPCVAFHPVFAPREQVDVAVVVGDAAPVAVPFEPVDAAPAPFAAVDAPPRVDVALRPGRLGDVAGARSGDKGGDANVGFWVRDDAHVGWLLDTLTEDRLRSWLGGFEGAIERHPLPGLRAVNFVVRGWLGLGVGASVGPDPQAKTLAEYLRTRTLDVPAASSPG